MLMHDLVHPTLSPLLQCFSCQPPDPVFPSMEGTDEKLISELVEGNRSQSQAKRVLHELSSACREASVELEVLLQVTSRCCPTHGTMSKLCRILLAVHA